MSHLSHSDKPLIAAITLVVVAYLAALASGYLPQTVAPKAMGVSEEPPPVERAEREASEEFAKKRCPPGWMILPFVILLGAIAVLPITPWTAHWWDHNRNKFGVAAVLSAVTLLYFLFLHDLPVQGEWPAPHLVIPDQGMHLATTWAVVANAILAAYVPFITLLFSLYTISGGIRVEGDLPARPLTNVAFLATGAVLASLIGTTGAAMLVIRPLLETNRERKHVKHTVIIFIFIVCNCGGCLLPLGDPPLFLGYLKGVPFLWTLRLWPEWLFVNALLLGIYFLWDHFVAYPRELPADLARDETRVHRLRFAGVWPNAALLACVIPSIALLDPGKPLPGTDWYPWLYLRELVQLVLVALSLGLTSPTIRRASRFNYGAMIEVAALFFGIFICMQPPLQILDDYGPSLGLSAPVHFFWASGTLSSVLDNAPTYVVFFEAAKTLGGQPAVAGVAEALVRAVSLGAVCMGAMTYIGNGPNFMVRAIAEKAGVPMPSFFGYLLYSFGILLPLLAVMTWIFL